MPCRSINTKKGTNDRTNIGICMNSYTFATSLVPTGKVGWNCRMNPGTFGFSLIADSTT